ncbi:hypothetical protein FPOAC1_007790 [Fusarium poae]|uniref:Uncharacterized protein n=1 Tax=Fusarium poae TaxID=36050 RepID=A0A1B8AIW6_FUSPO|nr:hypothetical protein FPOAC1_007790 [Fusarium poae]KAG8668411.1 hypothetical protein FPOAC1_007790 [Fusarium poae]OBS20495.1 hypothetical protein FPOA_06863 [Fusarium poae]
MTLKTQLRPSPPRRVTLAAQSPMTCERPRPPRSRTPTPSSPTPYGTVLYGFIKTNQQSSHPLGKTGTGGPPPGSHGQARWLLIEFGVVSQQQQPRFRLKAKILALSSDPAFKEAEKEKMETSWRCGVYWSISDGPPPMVT